MEEKIEVAPGIYAEILEDKPRKILLTNLTGNLDVELTRDEKEILEDLLNG